MFTATSRYYGLPVVDVTLPDGREIRCARPRMIPDPGSLTVVKTHIVAPGDRLDRIAGAHYFLDPEQAWRLADAHRVLDPDLLTQTPGTVLAFTVPATLFAAGSGR